MNKDDSKVNKDDGKVHKDDSMEIKDHGKVNKMLLVRAGIKTNPGPQ